MFCVGSGGCGGLRAWFYILENLPPPPQGKKYQQCHLGEKILKGKTKRRKSKKGRKGKEKEKMGSKRVK
jgi:hypothetical protein